jgi:hypothetical protein
VTVNTRVYVTAARPDIAARWPERQPNQCFTPQAISRVALPILKEVFLTLTMEQHPLKIWIFVANITNEFILGLDILCAYDASVYLGHQRLYLAEEEVSPWNPWAGPWPSSLVVAKHQVMPAQCEGIVMAGLESPFGVENGLVEPSPQAHPLEATYITETLVPRPPGGTGEGLECCPAAHRNQKLMRGSPGAHCEPVTLVTSSDVEQPQARDSSPKL